MNKDVRLNANFAKLLKDTMATSVDGPVLGVHDDLYGSRLLDVTSETGNFRNDDHDLNIRRT